MLLIAATVVSGLLGSISGSGPCCHSRVARPRRGGMGDYSRHADLQNGYVVYPIDGILCWALVFAAALAYRLDRSAPRQAGAPIYLAALGAAGARSVVTSLPRDQVTGLRALVPRSCESCCSRARFTR
jgi:hypothetical protein